jgi:16S rRNA (cytosine967-C5)-methyltransferase
MVAGSPHRVLSVPPLPPVILACTEGEALRVRPLVLAAYAEARALEWPFLSDVLERGLRSAAQTDRAAVTAAVHALARYDRLLGFAAQSESSADRFDALFALVRGEVGELCARLDRIELPTERFGVAFSFPDWIVDRVRAELGDAALAPALTRMNETAPRVARTNALRSTREECLGALHDEGVEAKAALHLAHAIVIDGGRSPFRTQAFARGDFEMQDEASQLVADLVAPPPGSFVVDACAGAGGKTLALAALLKGKGRVVALDASESKLGELARRARRAQASNVRPIAVDLLHPGERLREFEGRASRVLLDAPCSGLGAVRRNPEARWRLRPADLARLGEAQGALLRAVAGLVAPRGRLIFATCSFFPSEGERPFERFLSESSAFAPVTVRDVLGRARTASVAARDGRYLRTWRFDGTLDGGDAGMDGFFAAIARRAASSA